LLRGDGYRLPIKTASCDVAVMTDVIEHVFDPAALVQEVSAALRPDGMLVITTPYRATETPLELDRHILSGSRRGAIRSFVDRGAVHYGRMGSASPMAHQHSLCSNAYKHLSEMARTPICRSNDGGCA
jgi:SAM-dependent methyltransferase